MVERFPVNICHPLCKVIIYCRDIYIYNIIRETMVNGMKRVLTIASAFIGIIVGAGFASGQEILQYFTSFGLMGAFAAALSTVLFAYLGMMLVSLGSRMKAQSHKKVIYEISGNKYLGIIVDAVIIFTLFGVGVVMIAGAGSNLNQQFGIPHIYGSLLLVVLIILSGMLNVDRVVAIIGSITPFLIMAIALVSVYALFTVELPFSELSVIAQKSDSALPHWALSGVNYVSFNIAVGAAMSLVMGGAEEDERVARMGGLLGGLGLGVLIILSYFAILSRIDVVASYELPLLKLVDMISPVLGVIMSVVLFGMIFNTGLSMFYAFTARFVEMQTKKANAFLFVTVMLAFGVSFAGFTKLVEWFYPTIGFLGLFLLFALIAATFRLSKKGTDIK